MTRWLQVKWQNFRMKRIVKDDFVARLPSTVVGEGMMNEGNLYLFDFAIRNLPSEGQILEIGSFGGLSMNLLLHLLKKYGKSPTVFSCDPWLYSGYHDRTEPFPNHIDGNPDVLRTDYMDYIRESFVRSVRLLHPDHLPHTIQCTSDSFFQSWRTNEQVTDVFGRSVTCGGKLAFVYIDGDHSLEAARKDFENAMEFLVPGGFVLLDDSAAGLPYGSVKLIDEIRHRPDLTLIRANPNYLFQKRLEFKI
ncbi:MAG TPA: class I SAM-dependent methyltransferase [Catalimonadaceae bacterium]|nr:class I SAM-dependent methyltransferase [Catalimonadaceae bacterium]